MHTNSFIKYIEDKDYYNIDYRIYIDMDLGLKRFDQIRSYFKTREGTSINIMMDARGFSFDSEKTHLSLSKLSRDYFNSKFPDFKLAIVNDHYDSTINSNEKWFRKKEPALNWLLS